MSLPDLLFLAHRIPYPPEKGEKIRAFHMLDRLRRTHRIHLGCLADDPADMAHVPYLRTLCADVICRPVTKPVQKLRAVANLLPGRSMTQHYFHEPALARWVRDKLPHVDRSFIYCSAMAPYAWGAGAPPGILDMVDIDSEKWTEYGAKTGLPMSLVWAREGRTVLSLERRAARRFARSLFVSPAEAARFIQLAPESAARIGYVENGVDLARFSPDHAFSRPADLPEEAVVFTGTMDYWPNVDAVTWFADAVLPMLRTARPALGFAVVGARPTPAVLRLADRPGVTVTGRVADVRPYLAHAAAAVAPLRIARGIQNKVLEAMAMGRPVVASPQAFEGVRAEPGRELLVADGAEEMAAAILAILADAHAGLPAAARAAMTRHYDWDATLAPLDALLADLPMRYGAHADAARPQPEPAL